ncbi:MAG: hypothetical protein K9L79_13950 [Methylobacter tundripaludum]|nr:hypothetical protein [Methylobacter tundripaludum]
MPRKPYFNSPSGKVSLKNGRSVAVMMAFGNGERLRGRIETTLLLRNPCLCFLIAPVSGLKGVVLGEKRLLFAAKTLVKARLPDRKRIIPVSISERFNLIEWNLSSATTQASAFISASR